MSSEKITENKTTVYYLLNVVFRNFEKKHPELTS